MGATALSRPPPARGGCARLYLASGPSYNRDSMSPDTETHARTAPQTVDPHSGTGSLWIARHGNREDFVDPAWPQRAERPYDPGLSPDGHEQARRLAVRLRSEPVSRIYCSPFLRTVQTADAVAEQLDLPLFLEPGFGEWLSAASFPEFPQLLPTEELMRRFPRISLDHTPIEYPRYPESQEQVTERAGRVAERLMEAADGESILLVGHGATVAFSTRSLVPAAEECPARLCSLSKIVFRGRERSLELCGDVSHLEDSESTVSWGL